MDRLTCLVPTHRRPAFLRRLLRFYRECPPGFGFVVVDSSDDESAAENARVIAEAVAGGLQVEHRRLALDFVGKLAVALPEVRTPFVMLCADDDVLFPDACHKGVDFLEQNPGYVSAQGRTAQLYPGRKRFACMRLKGFDVDDDDPFVRCQRLADSFFSNFYSVYRRETLAENFRLTAAATDSRLSYTMPEMLLSQLSLIRGRVKVLPAMHLLMERHPTNAGYLGRTGERPQAEAMYRRFKECLVGELVRAGVAAEAADRHVDAAFGYFRETSLKHRSRARTPGAKAAHLVRSLVERVEDAFQCDRARHRRLIRAGDLAGSEGAWQCAVGLMREFPDGMPG
jgi:glycosyltransferase domain-containing protein